MNANNLRERERFKKLIGEKKKQEEEEERCTWSEGGLLSKKERGDVTF